MKTKLSHTEYLQLLGLAAIGGQHYRTLTDVRDAVYQLLGTTEDSNEDGGWIGDTVWGGDEWDVGRLLKTLKIEVDAVELPDITHYSEDATTAKCGDEMVGVQHKVTGSEESVTCVSCLAYLKGVEAGKEATA